MEQKTTLSVLLRENVFQFVAWPYSSFPVQLCWSRLVDHVLSELTFFNLHIPRKTCTAVFISQYPSTSAPYSYFIHPAPLLYNLSNWQYRYMKSFSLSVCLSEFHSPAFIHHCPGYYKTKENDNIEMKCLNKEECTEWCIRSTYF
jgi:hypothetical protein